MGSYIICFIITLFFAYINERNLKKNHPKKLVHRFTVMMIILIPAILAGARDYSIGTDVTVYAEPIFQRALNSNTFIQLYTSCSNSYLGSIEPGFLMIAYIVSKFTNDAHWFLFAISLFIQVFIYLVLYRKREICSIFIGEFIYLFIIYNESYNMMRQCMAIVIVLFAITFLMEQKYKQYVFFMIVSYLFHRSAVIGLLYWPVFILLKDKSAVDKFHIRTNKERQQWWIKLIGISIIITVVTVGFQTISSALIGIGLLSSKYLGYLVGTHSSISIKAFVYYILIITIIFLRRNKSICGYAFLSIAIADMFFYFLQGYMPYLYRIASYFLYSRVLSASQVRLDLSSILRTGKITKEGVCAIGVIICCIVYWSFFIVYWNNHETMPYLSSKLGIK